MGGNSDKTEDVLNRLVGPVKKLVAAVKSGKKPAAKSKKRPKPAAKRKAAPARKRKPAKRR